MQKHLFPYICTFIKWYGRFCRFRTVEDVCTYWPANAPGSACSLQKRRFYQKGRICLCHMPPGIYQQRLKINFGDLFEGGQISQFLINILFSGQVGLASLILPVCPYYSELIYYSHLLSVGGVMLQLYFIL